MGGSANVCVLRGGEGRDREGEVSSDLLSLPAKEEEEEEGTVLVFHLSPVHGCCYRQSLVCGSLCDWTRLCV